jgi:hypothetical protein
MRPPGPERRAAVAYEDLLLLRRFHGRLDSADQRPTSRVAAQALSSGEFR